MVLHSDELMKQVALGRKAWLFVGNVEAGERSAMMMTLVSSAKRHDLDVCLYIQDVLDHPRSNHLELCTGWSLRTRRGQTD